MDKKLKKKVRPSRYLIYGLLDSRDGFLKYIGKTHKRRELRLNEHLEAAANEPSRPVHVWLNELSNSEGYPTIFVLERVPGSSNWQEAERRHIAFWKSVDNSHFPLIYPPMTRKSEPAHINGVELLNQTEGG
jgi:hypothetical protein